MKKVLMFLYDSFAEFEISILITCLNGSDYELVTCSVNPSGQPVVSNGKLKILTDLLVDEVNTDDYEALIIPGGTPAPLLTHQALAEMIQSFYEKKKIIGAICGGPTLLGAAGILDHIHYTASITPEDKDYLFVMNWENKRDEHLIIDKNVITSTGSNYISFAEEVLRRLNIVPSDVDQPLQYFRKPSLG